MSKIKSIDDKSASSTPERVIDPLLSGEDGSIIFESLLNHK